MNAETHPTHTAEHTGPIAEFAAGELVVFRAWKYDGSPHWHAPSRYLGADEHGHWFSVAENTFISRPGKGFYSRFPGLVLLSATGTFQAKFFTDPNSRNAVYVDVITALRAAPLAPHGQEINFIDMDLDVVLPRDGGVYIDDEDEFVEHIHHFGYSASLVKETQRHAQAIYQLVAEQHAPFDGVTAAGWFATAGIATHGQGSH